MGDEVSKSCVWGVIIALIEFIINLIMFGVIQHECNTTYWKAWTSKQPPSDDKTANTLIWLGVSLAFIGSLPGSPEPCAWCLIAMSSIVFIIGFILTCNDIHNKC